MKDHLPFIRNIIDRPEDDNPRSVYADWLQDDGSGGGQSPWRPEDEQKRMWHRGELIRTQIELARMPKPRHTLIVNPGTYQHGVVYEDRLFINADAFPHAPEIGTLIDVKEQFDPQNHIMHHGLLVKEVNIIEVDGHPYLRNVRIKFESTNVGPCKVRPLFDLLKHREKLLLDEYGKLWVEEFTQLCGWRPSQQWSVEKDGVYWLVHHGTHSRIIGTEFRRGMIEKVSLQWGTLQTRGARIFRAAPVREVVLAVDGHSPKWPRRWGGLLEGKEVSWRRGGSIGGRPEPYDIPVELFDLLVAKKVNDTNNDRWSYHLTEQDAYEDLANACVKYGRKKAAELPIAGADLASGQMVTMDSEGRVLPYTPSTER